MGAPYVPSIFQSDASSFVYDSIIIDNYTITSTSPICGLSIKASGIRERGHCVIIGIAQRNTDDTITNPDPSIILSEGDTIIIAGEKQKIHDFFC